MPLKIVGIEKSNFLMGVKVMILILILSTCQFLFLIDYDEFFLYVCVLVRHLEQAFLDAFVLWYL